MEGGDLDLNICSQLILSGSSNRHLLAVVPLSPTKSVSFTELEHEIYISGSFLKKERSPEEKCMRITCIQKSNFLVSHLFHVILHDTYL